ncbi:MAG TPA: hypothetical protein VF389_06310, partial [Woeseiaceae bacterium]
MRIILAVFLALLCVPSGGASGRAPGLFDLAGVPIRVFDLQADGVSQAFREFMLTVPMTNARQVPLALIDDVVASLSFVKAATPAAMPAYFVAAYIQKTPFVAMADADRVRYLARYGEAVYPQRECPVFVSQSSASVSQLLGTASNLPTSYFEQVKGDARSFDRLFALTEVSHCGFIARELVQPTVLPPSVESHELRTILEALGDYEASVLLRSIPRDGTDADEVDALFAARLLATFLLERENPYTAVPALVLEYHRSDARDVHGRLGPIMQSVRLARQAVRSELEARGETKASVSLGTLERILKEADAAGRLAVDDPLAESLIAALDTAVVM